MGMEVGEIYSTNSCGKCVVLEVENSVKVTVEFIDTGTIATSTAQNIRNGEIKDILCRTVMGVGFIGIGPYNEAEHKDAKRTWRSMLLRCYDPKIQDKQPTYVGCWVKEEWHNFQNFAEWYENYPNRLKGWHLDKDILVNGNRVYSKDTCCLVPQQINKLLLKSEKTRGIYPLGVCFDKSSGTLMVQVSDGDGGNFKTKGFKDVDSAFQKYKEVKETIIKKQAEKYKPVLQENVYNALINYEVNEEN